MTEAVSERGRQDMIDETLLRRAGTADQVAAAVQFLVAPPAPTSGARAAPLAARPGSTSS